MINKQKLYSITLVSAAMILMMVSIAGAAPFAYITNSDSNTVSVIDTATDNITATVNVESLPFGVAVTPDGTKVYIANVYSDTVSVINTTTNTVTATVNVGLNPYGVAVTPDGTKVYVTIQGSGIVSVINTANNTVIAPVNVVSGSDPLGVAVTPDGSKVYVTNWGNSTVSVINTSTNSITATVYGLNTPYGVAVTPDGSTVYVANQGNSTVSVINTTTNTVTAPVNVGNIPRAFGQFIGKAIPTITWSNPTNITYGTALSETQLDATASVPGNFAYNPEAETVLSAGLNQQLNTTFTPTDTQNYTTATDIVYINVTKATPTINWNNPANMTYGTALSNIQLDATSPESGTFAYNPVTGTVLSADLNQQLNTTFTPSGNDAVNYTTASATVFINVTPATPAITWSNPDDIVYGTALSDTQLDAKGSVPGIFVYTPSSGTILNAGTQTLDVSFTPNDAINYTTASASVTMNVLTPTPKIILSPTQKIQQMIAFIQGITTSGELDEGSSIELTAILQAAEKNIDRNPFAEPAELRYFITDVKDKIDLGVLSQTNGQTLIDAANDIINSLRNQGR